MTPALAFLLGFIVGATVMWTILLLRMAEVARDIAATAKLFADAERERNARRPRP